MNNIYFSPYRISTITCNANIGNNININLGILFDNIKVIDNVAEGIDKGIVWVQFMKNGTDVSKGVYPKKRRKSKKNTMKKNRFDNQVTVIYKFSDTKGQVLSKDINKVFDLMFDFYKNTSALSICFAQTGDFIGGVDNGKGVYRFAKRKCMNSFFCSTERPFSFVGSINEDVNTYTTLAGMGGLFLTIPVFAINQKDSQTQKNGMSDIYKLQGTYIKSFTTVLMQPSNVSISMMNASHKRIHHSIKWINTTPMILNEKYKKQF